MRQRKPERALRDAVAGLRADLPSKLRKHEDITVRAFIDHVDPRDPFPLVFAACQFERRVCRCEGDIRVCEKSYHDCLLSDPARTSSCCSLGSVRTSTFFRKIRCLAQRRTP